MDFYSAAGILQRFIGPAFRLRDFALAGALRSTGNEHSIDATARPLGSAMQGLLQAVPEVVFNG
jgi:hypothetical protein